MIMYGFMFGQMLLMSSVLLGNGLMGLPPGERDPVLARCAPQDALLYAEWASRSAGKRGAKGIDGLAADPEVRAFLKEAKKTIRIYFAKKTEKGMPQERILGRSLPPLIQVLLNQPGCLYFSHDGPFVKPKVNELKNWLVVLKKSKGTLIISGGKQADSIEKLVRALLEIIPEKQRQKKLDRQRIPLPKPFGEVVLHRYKNYFILGYGVKTIDRAIAGLSGKSQGLLGNPQYVKSMQQVRYQRTASLTWINLPRILKKAKGVLGKEAAQILKAIKIDEIGPMALSAGVVEGVIHHRIFVRTSGKTDGLLAFVSGRSLKRADLKHVPADCDMLFAFSLNAPKILNTVRKAVAASDGEKKNALEKAIRNLEKELGIRLEKDLFEAYGDVWVFHDSKSAGGFFVTSLVGSLEVRDPKKADDVFTKLTDALEEALSEKKGGLIKSKQFMGQTIYAIQQVGDSAGLFGISGISLCQTETHLLIGLNPQVLKSHIRFLKSQRPNWTSRFGKDIKLFRDGLQGFSFLETKPLIRVIYGYVAMFWPTIVTSLRSENIQFDIFSLPSARAVLPYVGNSVSTIRRTKTGILIESRSSLPIPYNGLWYFLLMLSG